MDCETVREALSECHGKTPRDRRVRAHLAACSDCREFQASIKRRRMALAAFVPPLAPAAAGEILGTSPHNLPGTGGLPAAESTCPGRAAASRGAT